MELTKSNKYIFSAQVTTVVFGTGQQSVLCDALEMPINLIWNFLNIASKPNSYGIISTQIIFMKKTVL